MAKIKIFGGEFENLQIDVTHYMYNIIKSLNDCNMLYNDVDINDFVEYQNCVDHFLNTFNDCIVGDVFQIKNDLGLSDNDGYILNVDDIKPNYDGFEIELKTYKYKNHTFVLNATFKHKIYLFD